MLNLSEIFRYTLQTDKTLIALSEELEIVRAYLEIEKLRLGPRLQTELDVEEAALSVKVPILSIQPLVENAVKHGLSLSSKEGWLRLRAKIVGNLVQIRIEDTGVRHEQWHAHGAATRRGSGTLECHQKAAVVFRTPSRIRYRIQPHRNLCGVLGALGSNRESGAGRPDMMGFEPK